jgi:hypothetical protein
MIKIDLKNCYYQYLIKSIKIINDNMSEQNK